MTRDTTSTPHQPAAPDLGDAFAADVQYYLQQEPRQLPSRYLYDDLGSALFDAICHLPWYPITRAERRLLELHARALFARIAPSTIVELGCGSGEKLMTVLRAPARRREETSVHLVDLSPAALASAVAQLATLDGLTVTTHAARYEEGLQQAARTFRRPGTVLVLFLGSNIGNFDPPASEALLRGIRAQLRIGDGLLLGADLVKPAPLMERAYDDPLGVTAAFNRNLLVRVNRELGANFDLDRFAHRAVWNASASRMEMHLVAQSEQRIDIAAASLHFTMRAEESIWTESSYKYRVEDVSRLLGAAGFRVAEQWIDGEDLFALTLAEAA